MKDRIKQLQEYVNMSQQDFASCLGISPATLSGINTGRTQPTTKLVKAIHEAFPEVSVNWLMFGDGQMMASPQAEASSSANATTNVQSNSSNGANSASAPALLMPSEGEATGLPLAGFQFAMGDETAASPHRQTPASRRENQGRDRDRFGYGNNAKNLDNHVRKIKEIRVFFDDGTYESFVPSSK